MYFVNRNEIRFNYLIVVRHNIILLDVLYFRFRYYAVSKWVLLEQVLFDIKKKTGKKDPSEGWNLIYLILSKRNTPPLWRPPNIILPYYGTVENCRIELFSNYLPLLRRVNSTNIIVPDSELEVVVIISTDVGFNDLLVDEGAFGLRHARFSIISIGVWNGEQKKKTIVTNSSIIIIKKNHHVSPTANRAPGPELRPSPRSPDD